MSCEGYYKDITSQLACVTVPMYDVVCTQNIRLFLASSSWKSFSRFVSSGSSTMGQYPWSFVRNYCLIYFFVLQGMLHSTIIIYGLLLYCYTN